MGSKKYYDFNFELKIDGEPHSAERASPLFQRDPFPGGHRYSCVISGKRLGKYFDYLPLGGSESVLEEDARRFFLSLGMNWSPDAENGDGKLEYFLNGVEAIDFDGERIRFCGVCSPVVRG
ncbi:MAG TPA: hypothetical protein VJU84_21665 [Pyrinomonadaceae bacterium]|nr:hypothetical protein [Pyrinomonadaceae bacterium]